MAKDYKAVFYDLKALAERRRQEARPGGNAPRVIGEYVYRLYTEVRPALEGKRCLEIGVGTGWAMQSMLDAGAAWVDGIDVSEQRLDEARQVLGATPHANWRVWVDDAETLAGCEDGAYDYVDFSDVLEHLPHYGESIRSIRRVLKPGGEVFLKTPNNYTDSDLKLHHYLHVLLAGFLPRRIEQPGGNELMLLDDIDRLTEEERGQLEEAIPEGFHEHVHQFYPDELARFVEDAGFEIVKLAGWPLFTDILFNFEQEVPNTCACYVDLLKTGFHEQILQALQRDLEQTGERPELCALPADYVFSDNLVVVARKPEG